VITKKKTVANILQHLGNLFFKDPLHSAPFHSAAFVLFPLVFFKAAWICYFSKALTAF
jgi:hypothetical protein